MDTNDVRGEAYRWLQHAHYDHPEKDKQPYVIAIVDGMNFMGRRKHKRYRARFTAPAKRPNPHERSDRSDQDQQTARSRPAGASSPMETRLPIFALNPMSRSGLPISTPWATTSRKHPKATSTSCFLDTKDFPTSSWKPSRRTRTRSSARSRPANTPAPRIAASLSFERQPALLLGSRTRQPLRHHLLPDAGICIRLPEGRAQPAAPDRETGRRRLHRSHPTAELCL